MRWRRGAPEVQAQTPRGQSHGPVVGFVDYPITQLPNYPIHALEVGFSNYPTTQLVNHPIHALAAGSLAVGLSQPLRRWAIVAA